MLGVFQGEVLRVELEATLETIQSYLVEPVHLRSWIWPQTLDPDLSEPLRAGTEFFSQLGSIRFGHRVENLQPGLMHLLLWGAADGFCQWSWGNGWVQLRIEAVSLLPLSLGQIILLQRLQAYGGAQAPPQRGDTLWPHHPLI